MTTRNYNVDLAESGEKALRLIHDNRYNLIITDMRMDAVDGLSVLRAAKDRDKNTQVLIITGHGNISSAVQAIREGAYDYLTKPVNTSTFLLHVNKALYDQDMDRQLQYQKRKIDEYHDMLDRDLAFAKKIQASLIPESFSDSGFDFGICHIPMIRIGGDFGTIYKDTANNQIYLNILDVTGHGITAALVVNRICSEIGSLVRENRSPREILFAINSFFCDILGQTGMFLTMFSGRIDLNRMSFEYSGSAHPAGLHYCTQQKQFVQLESENVIIGFETMPLDHFRQRTVDVKSGDTLVLYTDGIIEAEDREKNPYGLEKLKKALEHHRHKSAKEAAHLVVKEVKSYNKGENKDDIMLMLLKLK